MPVNMTFAEAKLLWPLVQRFRFQHKRDPNIQSSDSKEQRLAQCLLFLRQQEHHTKPKSQSTKPVKGLQHVRPLPKLTTVEDAKAYMPALKSFCVSQKREPDLYAEDEHERQLAQALSLLKATPLPEEEPQMTEVEAKILWPQVLRFQLKHKRAPQCESADPVERRLAQALRLKGQK